MIHGVYIKHSQLRSDLAPCVGGLGAHVNVYTEYVGKQAVR